jgi:hypothetical protein
MSSIINIICSMGPHYCDETLNNQKCPHEMCDIVNCPKHTHKFQSKCLAKIGMETCRGCGEMCKIDCLNKHDDDLLLCDECNGDKSNRPECKCEMCETMDEEEEEVCSNPKCSGRNYGEVKNGFCNNCRPCECGKCDVVGGSCEVEDEDDEHECDEDDSEKMRK